ncbi:MAG: hypothetical protein MHM6MM_007885 [Cercozoa sp. M6MM]
MLLRRSIACARRRFSSFEEEIPDLSTFIRRSEVLKTYRRGLRLCRHELMDKRSRQEMRQQVRREFRAQRHVQDTSLADYHLSIAQQRLDALENMLSQMQ